ncbi:hypothetical protein V6N13_030639 [Hibiscus sabdariffa]|uniref:Uncharacterized protein n=1 Tax=Hibiscus sabdariffa TaxID=183260 RepID=A0ABR2D5S8_9ROSI
MKTPPSYVSRFLAVVIILGFVQVSSCRYLEHAASNDGDQRLRDKYYPVFFGKPGPGTEHMTSFHAVSRRLVPGGPNPLHN